MNKYDSKKLLTLLQQSHTSLKEVMEHPAMYRWNAKTVSEVLKGEREISERFAKDVEKSTEIPLTEFLSDEYKSANQPNYSGEKLFDFMAKKGITTKEIERKMQLGENTVEFQNMCREYDYAAIGGIVSGEIKSNQYKAFPMMIDEAHKNGCKLHGLGFTTLSWLPKCHFDSVDSTAWTTGNRFGFIYQFTGTTMKKIDCPKGKRLGDSRKVALINYSEWIKFQQYAERNL